MEEDAARGTLLFGEFQEGVVGQGGDGLATGLVEEIVCRRGDPSSSGAWEGRSGRFAGTKLKLKIKPGTQPGSKVRLRGKGQGGGDLIITYNVTLPATLTERQRQLLEEMRRS